MNNKNLLIEIKDTHSNITLTTFSHGKWRVLSQKKYLFKSTTNDEEIHFDNSWIKEMKSDILKVISIAEITKSIIVLNTTGTLIRTDSKVFNSSIEIKDIKKQLLDDLKVDFKSASVIGLTINEVKKNLYKLSQEVLFTYELISSSFLEEVYLAFENEDLIVNKIIATHKVNRYALKSYANNYGYIFNVNIEEKFTVINTFKDGKYLSSYKRLDGLDKIYKNISEKMNISRLSAKKLFSTLGEIPPESIQDNKIIFVNKMEDGSEIAYSKKDLSRYITEEVNAIFSGIVTKLNPIKELKPAIIFSGEITSLNGFEKYAKTSLDINSILVFKLNTVGISSDSSMIYKGVFEKIKKEIENKQEIEIQLNKERYSINITRTVIGLMDRLKKQFNYI